MAPRAANGGGCGGLSWARRGWGVRLEAGPAALPSAKGESPLGRDGSRRGREGRVHLWGARTAPPPHSSPVEGTSQEAGRGVPACSRGPRSARRLGKGSHQGRRSGSEGQTAREAFASTDLTLFPRWPGTTPVRPSLLLVPSAHLSHLTCVWWTGREASTGQGCRSPREPAPPGLSCAGGPTF